MGRKPSIENMLPLARPSLINEWHPTKNRLIDPSQISIGSTKKIWWKCPKGDDHEWQSSPNSRSNGTGCPICSGKKVVKSNCLSTTHPELANEWHPTKNGSKLPEHFTAGTLTKVWWKCPNGDDHEWQAQINNRKNGNGCPYCFGRKSSLTNNIKITNPQLAAEWHPTKNNSLTPNDVTIGMTQKVWWKCEKGADHEWQMALNLRGRGYGCPICSGRKVTKSNCLAILEPKIAIEWDFKRNGKLTPSNITIGSSRKIWWKCPKEEDHLYECTISDRRRGLGCPMCSGRKVVYSNCLAILRPDLASEWYQPKNGNITPRDVTTGSPKKFFWKCEKGQDHIWPATVNARNSGTNCPFCANKKLSITNSLFTNRPDLVKEIHNYLNNGIDPKRIIVSSKQSLWWQCKNGSDHIWKASVNSRVNGAGCHICWGRKVVNSNSLSMKLPKLLEEWDYHKNHDKPSEIYFGSLKKYWWKCPKGKDHEWQASVSKRVKGTGCPMCIGQKVVESNSLKTLRPDLASEWHLKNNGTKSPSEYTIGSSKLVWWKCPKGEDHVWQAAISSRAKGVGCPVCSGYKVVHSNCLSTTHPKVAKNWHHTLNGKLSPKDVIGGSPKKVWWKCDKGIDHEWRTSVRHRTQRGTGCPFCTLTPQSKQELTITFELMQFFNINPRGFKTRIDGKLISVDIYLKELNLVIEFDGSYWHKGKTDLDKLKTERLSSDGFQIMRIREEPLKPITPIDVISQLPFNAKKVTDEILQYILKAFSLDTAKVEKIKAYIKKKTLKNEDGLLDYIESILEEKSKKKIKRTITAAKPH
jgi:hypothetical protein